MAHPLALPHLVFDASVRGLLGFRRRLINAPAGEIGPGASLPGGQAHLAADILPDPAEGTLLQSGDTKHSMWRTVEWHLMRAAVGPLPAPVLDLGCGDGAFGALLRESIDFGIDGDREAVSNCPAGVFARTFVGDIRDPLPVAAGSLGGIFSNSTLEHIENVEAALQSAATALRPGGTLVFSVPTEGMTRAVAGYYGAGFADRLNAMLGHHNLWDWSQWGGKLGAAGFDRIQFRGYLAHLAMQWYASRQLAPWPQLARRKPHWLWNHDQDQMRRLVRLSLAPLTEREATCVLITAVRSSLS